MIRFFLSILVPFCLGAGLFWGLLLWSYEGSFAYEKIRFDTHVKEREFAILGLLRQAEESVKSLVSLYNASSSVEPDEFRIAVKTIVQRDYVRSVMYLPRVRRDDLKDFETYWQSNGLPGFAVRDYADNQPQQASQQSDYYPVLYNEPFSVMNSLRLGTDYTQDKDFAHAAKQVVRNGALEGLVHGTAEGKQEYWLVDAVYTTKNTPDTYAQRLQNLMGYVVLAVDVQAFMDVVEQADKYSYALLYDPLYRAGRITLYEEAVPQANRTLFINLTLPVLTNESELAVGQDTLVLKVTQALSLGAIKWSYIALAAGVGGLGWLIIMFVGWRVGRHYKMLYQTQQSSDKRFQSALDSAVHGIVLVAPDGRFIQANQAFCRMLGYTEEALLKTDFQTITYVDDLDADQALVQECLAGKRVSYQMEKRYVRKNGQLIWVMLAAAVVRNEQGKADYFVAQVIDMSEQKAAAEALEQARDAAQAADRAKSAFLAGMSHEVRTPLNGILGTQQLLGETALNTQQREYMDIISRSAKTLIEVIDNVLDFAKIEAGQIELEAAPFNLSTLLHEVARHQADLATQNKVEIIVAYPAGTAQKFMGDPTRLRQIMHNLVQNAVKFTQAGTVWIEALVVQHRDHETSEITLHVKDTGQGIEADRLDSLFDKLADGKGLGLNISQQLIHKMGGKLQVKSTPGKGSDFYFTIHLPTSQTQAALPENWGDLTTERGLLVDDNEINLRVLSDLLTEWGVAHVTAESPAHAREVLAEEKAAGRPITFGILDYQMPDESGLEFGQWLKEQPEFQAIRLLLLTSNNNKGDGKACAKAGFMGYLAKPINASLLHDALATMVVYEGQMENGHQLVTEHSLAEQAQQRKPRPSRKKAHTGEAVPVPVVAEEEGMGERYRILLVEDNESNRLVAEHFIGQVGGVVDVAIHGQEALEKVKENSYDLIFMDCQMPVMDGFEATTKIRHYQAKEGQKHVPIIALTANAMQGDRERCLKAGMDDYLTKPVKKEDIQQVIQHWLVEDDA